jgi:hypothetical protein
MFVNWNFFGHTVSYLTILKKTTKPITLKRRHSQFKQRCVPSESYTATDALPILPACRQPLLPACVFVTRDTVRYPRCFLFVMRGDREPRFQCTISSLVGGLMLGPLQYRTCKYTEWPQKMYTLFILYFTCQSVYIFWGHSVYTETDHRLKPLPFPNQ